MKLPLKVKYLDKNVPRIIMPREGDVGIDVYASEEVRIGRGECAVIKTGVAMELPKGYFLQVRDRSSRAKNLHLMAGVLDCANYRGEVLLVGYCHTATETNDYIFIPKHAKVAQLVIEHDLNSQFEIVETDNLSETERGSSGFGSTGN